MDPSRRPDVADALVTLTGGDELTAARLMSLVYGELRTLAANYFRRQPAEHTLQPTALVHEAFIKVAERTGEHYESRAHFLAVCAVAMRQILADHARHRRRDKRGGNRHRVTLSDAATPFAGGTLDALAFDEALTELAEQNERQARMVEYRFFAGMTVAEVSEVLGVSRSTVEEDWRMARAWLMMRLGKGH